MRTRLHTLAFLAGLATLLSLARGEGSTITWTNEVGGFGSNTTGVGDIPTAGTPVDGVYFGASGNQTVGTDVFHPATHPTSTTAQSPSGDIGLAYPNLDAPTGPGVSPSGYGTVLDVGNYGADPSNVGVAITFSNLLAGENYQAQIWVTQDGGADYQMSLTAGNTITLKADVNAPSTPTGTDPGQFALGTFSTSGVGLQTETLTLNLTAGPGPYPFLNAIALRDLGPISVPEPGSMVLLGLGAIGLLLAARRRTVSE